MSPGILSATVLKQIEAVILDMDGLMLDTEPVYKSAWQTASAGLGYALDDRFYSKLVGRPMADCERELAAYQTITPRAPSALASAASASLISRSGYVRVTSSRSFSVPSR